MATTIKVNGVDRMLYMESTSAADGTYNLTVTFQIGTDPDIDQVLVQNRVQIALASLPEPVQSQGNLKALEKILPEQHAVTLLHIEKLDREDIG